MRGWCHLIDGYLAECLARAACAGSVGRTASILERWSRWRRTRRPPTQIERIDAEQITRFIQSRTSLRSKSTASGTLSVMRCRGDYLVRKGVGIVTFRDLLGHRLITTTQIYLPVRDRAGSAISRGQAPDFRASQHR